MRYEQRVFAAKRATIGRVSARMRSARRSGHTGSVHASPIPHDLVVLAPLSEDSLVEALPPDTFGSLWRVCHERGVPFHCQTMRMRMRASLWI
ncbi:hypothetical protein, partial [Noviherbaspirillum sp.]|uniref:hypothetical protein n=1 Tax=Noviherbaspirillum sp. TaxID=1926288 RepID=UPI002FE2D9F3